MLTMAFETLVASACLVVFVGLVLFAALSDIATMEIPNWVSIAVAALFPLAAFLAGFSALQIGVHVGIGFLVFLAGFGLFALGILGGGDVKVIAAASIWTGAAALSPFTFATTLAGGGLAFLMILARKAAKPADSRPVFINRLLNPQNGIPYAVAIAAGVIASLPSQPIVRALFS
jgi:prepilin peptidase CpaA